MKRFCLIILIVFILSGCGGNMADNAKDCDLMIDNETCVEDVVSVIANKDFEKLSGFVYPKKEIRFSSDAYIDESGDLSFSVEEVANIGSDKRIYLWGYYDGSGEPVLMNFEKYWDVFVYDEDYVNAPEKSVNERIGMGNSIDNLHEFYLGADVYEYHFSGFEPEFEGLDWSSLRLVFEKYVDGFVLAAIVHDQWTI